MRLQPKDLITNKDSLVVQVQGHGVANEVLSTRFEAELLVYSLHRVLVQVDTCTYSISETFTPILDDQDTPWCVAGSSSFQL